MRALLHPKTILALLLVYAAAFGCTSERGEEKNWRKNKDLVDQYSNEFPAFKDAIQKRFKEAEEMFAKAKAEADEKKRVQGMQDANERLKDLVGDFQGYKEKRDELRRLLGDADLQNLPAREFNALKHSADAALALADNKIKEAGASATGIAAGTIKDILKEANHQIEQAAVPLRQKRDDIVAKRQAEEEARKAAAQATSQPQGGTASGGTQ